MNKELAMKLEKAANDYREVVGEPFRHFFCPILFKDEEAELCKAHLVNQAFPNSSRRWTVQRVDVDGFFGSVFESDFVDLRHRGSSVSSFYNNPSSVKHLQPRMYLNGAEVDYYLPKGSVPSHHSEIQISPPIPPVRLALKTQLSEMPNGERIFLEVGIEKDCRMSGLVSTLKSAHLIMFDMLGYRYGLSAGGMFLGRDVLGKFFSENRGLTKKQVLLNAENHFPKYSNLVRPITNPEILLRDTVKDRAFYIGEGLSRWAFLVLIKTSNLAHAALVPMLETPDAAAHFVNFLDAKGTTIHARECHFDGESFCIAPATQSFSWPESNFR